MDLTTSTRGFLLIIAILILSSIGSVYYLQNEIEGCARIVNYSGIVRGASQRLIKLEIANKPSDELIEYLDEIVTGLINGSSEIDLPRADDTKYLLKINLVEKSWNEIKALIFKVRKSPNVSPLLLEKSEIFFSLTNDAVLTAEDFSKRKVLNLKYLLIVILIIITLILFIVWTVSHFKIAKTKQSLVESEDILRETEVKLKKSEQMIQMQKEIKAFITTSQYLANLTSYQNVRSEIKKIIRNTFKVDHVCFAHKNTDGEIHISKNQGEHVGELKIIPEEILEKINDVIDSEILNTFQITYPEPYAIVIFPLKVGYHVNEVILIGHKTTNEISNATLEIYLGVSSLVGTMINRLALHSKLEEAYETLEQKVVARTKELSEKNLELVKIHREMEILATIDSLTKLLNRRSMLEKIDHEKMRCERSGFPFTIIMTDIDNFKFFNDKHGHDCGDFVLVSIANIMMKIIRKQDFVARWGGEEFLLLLPDTNLSGGQIIAEKIREIVAGEIYKYDSLELSVTMTFGVCAYEFPMDIEECIKKADTALYKGKESGKNCVVLSDL